MVCVAMDKSDRSSATPTNNPITAFPPVAGLAGSVGGEPFASLAGSTGDEPAAGLAGGPGGEPVTVEGELIFELNRLLAADPDNTAALYDRGITRYNLGDLDGALADLERVLELDFDHNNATDQALVWICIVMPDPPPSPE